MKSERVIIELSDKDLHFIFAEEYPYIMELLDSNVFCGSPTCGTQKNGMIMSSASLNHLNDISFEGACKNCGGNTGRYVEAGENADFFERAELIRTRLKLNAPKIPKSKTAAPKPDSRKSDKPKIG